MDKKLSETTKFCVEIMKSRRQVRGKIGQVVGSLPFDANVIKHQGGF